MAHRIWWGSLSASSLCPTRVTCFRISSRAASSDFSLECSFGKKKVMGLETDDRDEFSTVVFMPRPCTLLINALTERVGSVLVEVSKGASGEPLRARSFAE